MTTKAQVIYTLYRYCALYCTHILEHLWRGVIDMRRTCVVTWMRPTSVLTPFTFAFHTLRNTPFLLLFIHNNLLKLLLLILIWVVVAISSSAPLWS